MNTRMLLNIMLILAIFISAVLVVYIRHENRHLFIALQDLEVERNKKNEEWSSLLLEQATYGTQHRVERIAKKQLKMINPSVESTAFIRD